jgi:hypothetical protein
VMSGDPQGELERWSRDLLSSSFSVDDYFTPPLYRTYGIHYPTVSGKGSVSPPRASIDGVIDTHRGVAIDTVFR